MGWGKKQMPSKIADVSLQQFPPKFQFSRTESPFCSLPVPSSTLSSSPTSPLTARVYIHTYICTPWMWSFALRHQGSCESWLSLCSSFAWLVHHIYFVYISLLYKEYSSSIAEVSDGRPWISSFSFSFFFKVHERVLKWVGKACLFLFLITGFWLEMSLFAIISLRCPFWDVSNPLWPVKGGILQQRLSL